MHTPRTDKVIHEGYTNDKQAGADDFQHYFNSTERLVKLCWEMETELFLLKLPTTALVGTHLMLDIETMGNTPGAAIISIGAVFIKEGKLAEEFYMRTSLESCMQSGLTCDPSTIVWWMGQDEDARKSITTESKHIGEALIQFHQWVHNACNSDFKDLQVWGNASTFDVVLIEEACRRMQYPIPWKFWGHRCYRTMKNMFPNVAKPDFVGVKHHALDDAKFQALHLISIFNHINSLQNAFDSATNINQTETHEHQENKSIPVEHASSEECSSKEICRHCIYEREFEAKRQEAADQETSTSEGSPICKVCGGPKEVCTCPA